MRRYLLARLRRVPGPGRRLRIQQSRSEPGFRDQRRSRTRCGTRASCERDVDNSLVVNLAGSSQVQPHLLAQPAEPCVSVPDRDAVAAVSRSTRPRRCRNRRSRQPAPAHNRCSAASPICKQYLDQRCGFRVRHPAHGADLRHHARAAILAGVAGDIRQILGDAAKDVPRGRFTADHARAESRPCTTPSSACCLGWPAPFVAHLSC